MQKYCYQLLFRNTELSDSQSSENQEVRNLSLTSAMPFGASDNYWKQLKMRPSLGKYSTASVFPAFGVAALKGGKINGGGLSEPLLCICGNELLMTSEWKVIKCLK